MNWDQIEGKSKQLTGSAQEQWGKLTGGAEDQAEKWSRALQATKPENSATRL
jgi:uncharacterized protein YjbJ (UPF0337 family)